MTSDSEGPDIAAALRVLADRLDRLRGTDLPGTAPSPEARARKLLRDRRIRDRHFGAELFGEPAWDMLLDLYAAALEDRPISVSSLCIAAAVPPTTALRWVVHLEQSGHVARRKDPDDGRRVLVTLTEATRQALSRYLAAIAATRP